MAWGKSQPYLDAMGLDAMGRWDSMSGNTMGGVERWRMRGWRKNGWLGALAVAIGVSLCAAPAMRADDPGPGPRAVRLSSVDGQVQISLGGQVAVDTAVANSPLIEGTRVATGDEGRAEIQFEDGSMARLSPNSSLTLTVLRGTGASSEAEISLEGGLGYFEIQGGGQSGAFKVRFGDSVVTANGSTVIRVNLDNAPGALAVFSGNAHLEHGSAVSLDLHGGESVALSATDATHFTLDETIEPDSWDAWNTDRDQALAAEAADRTGASSGLGQSSNPAWNDLDANGSWYNVPDQGQVWSPTDASDANWDPYGSGYWVDTPGYGYGWVSGYAWGYLPYQCGMWNWYETFGWGWAPGAGGCGTAFLGVGYFGGGGLNVGRGFLGYHPPMRPRSPLRPVRSLGLIAVERHTVGPNITLPARNRNSTVQIAGYAVTPMRTLTVRPAYDHSGMGSNTTLLSNGTVVTHVGGVPATGQGRPGGAVYNGSRPPAATGTTAKAPPAKSGSGGGGSHVSSSGGGGGGGGGASHPSGGGGGGAHH